MWGEPSWDTVLRADESFPPDTRGRAAIVDGLGGSGANTAATLSLLGLGVRIVGSIGNDLAGQTALRQLRDRGVESDLFPVGSNRRTVSIASGDGRRTMYGSEGNQYVAEISLDPLRHHDARIVYCSFSSIMRAKHDLSGFLRRVCQSGAPLLLDAGNAHEISQLGSDWALKVLDALGPSLLLANEDEFSQLVVAWPRLGATPVVVKRGARACSLVFEGEQLYALAPPEVVEPVDTTGAGDAFAAGFLAGLLRAASLHECMELGHRIARRCVESLGATVPEGSALDQIRTDLSTRPKQLPDWLADICKIRR